MPATAARSLAAMAVMGWAVAMVVLPVLIALGFGSEAVARVGVGLGALAAVTGGGKLAGAVFGAARVALDSSGEIAQAID